MSRRFSCPSLGLAGTIALFVTFALGCSDSPAAGEGAADGGVAQDVAETPDDVGTEDVATWDIPPEPDISKPTGDVGEEDGSDAAAEPLTLSLVDPTSGTTVGGALIAMEGTGFTEGVVVTFGESAALDVMVIDSHRLIATSPPRPPGLVSVRVLDPVTEAQATLENAFLYYNAVQVQSVDPTEGHVDGGTPLTITGAGFIAGSKVLVGTRAAISVQVVDDTTILAVAPNGVVGPASVHVSNAQGIGSLKNGYFYYDDPLVSGIEPPVGPIQGGNPVTLTGTGLSGDLTVRFGDAFATVQAHPSAESVTVTAPPAKGEGPVDVHVVTDWGTTTVPGGYIYTDPFMPNTVLIPLGVAPSQGPLSGGGTATVVAYGLTNLEDTAITFGGIVAEPISVNAAKHSAVVEVPAGAAVGSVKVVISNSLGSAEVPGGYTYLPEIHVDDVTPALGPISGGTQITVTGSGFAPGAIVRVGALPATGVVVQSGSTLKAVTPPGSAGFVPVKVTVGDLSATRKDGFFYQGGGIELLVIEPALGSMAGGTFVKLVGSSFPADSEVFIGGAKASHTVVHDGTLITAKTPPGDIGTVPVEVRSVQGAAMLPDAFTYFNPTSNLGGTWGGGVEGDVNVTVLDAQSGDPVSDAFVILSVDPETPYQGFTNLDGQVTFSGPDVLGTQQVSVSKNGYESNSVIKFNAKNITIYLVPIPPPSPGAPPPGVAPPVATGRVFGLAKYVIVPMGTCNSKLGLVDTPFPMCQTCSADSCGPGYVCNAIGDQGNRCTKECTAPTDCPTGFVCGSSASKTVCLPSPGMKVARCTTTKPNVLTQDLEALIGTWGPKYEVTEDGGDYEIYLYPGESAVVCQGGYVEYDTQEFVPLTMGVARHILAAPGQLYPDNDVELKHPMDRTITLRLDDPPLVNGPEIIAAFTYLDLGTDGVVEMKHSVPVVFGNGQLLVERQLNSFTDLLYDASFSFLAGAFSLTDDNLPMSLTLHKNITGVDDNAMVELGASGWSVSKTGISKNINDLWGSGPSSVFAVGPEGLIAWYGGASWTQQQSPAKVDLNGVWGFGADDAVIVGDAGTVLRFDGITWKQVPVTGTTADLFDVWGASPDEMWAVGFYTMLRWDGATWAPVPATLGSTAKSWTAIWGADKNTIFAVGSFGQVSMWNGSKWTAQTSGTSQTLRGVWGSGPADVWAVGDGGTVIHWDGVAWTLNKPDTIASLRGVWGTGPSDVTVVGSDGTILRWDGSAWQKKGVGAFRNQLEAIWGWGPDKAVAAGSAELVLGPILPVPKAVTPAKNGVMAGYTIAFDSAPGVAPHFNLISVAIPGLMGDTPVWTIITDGSVQSVNLPDFPNIEGTPGIAPGTLKLTTFRVYKEGFAIDNYDYTDLNQLEWRSWAVDQYFFQKL